jgi:hypothetical protein
LPTGQYWNKKIMRPRFMIGTIIAAAALIVAFKFLTVRNAPPGSPAIGASASIAAAEKPPPTHQVAPVRQEATAQHPVVQSIAIKQTPNSSVAPEGAPAFLSPHVLDSRHLVAELAGLTVGATAGVITREQAEKFKQNLERLVLQGASAVPAIREYLEKNINFYYNEVNGGDQLGFSSLRAGLFDALKQIGGPEAEAAMLRTLQTTAVPSEILDLAKILEQQAPGQYRDEILTAAHETLNMSSANQLGTNVEIGPIFRIFQVYSEPDARAVSGTETGEPGSK